MTTEWRLCSDGVSSPHSRPITEAEAQRIMREGVAYGGMNGLWLERREVSDWKQVDSDGKDVARAGLAEP